MATANWLVPVLVCPMAFIGRLPGQQMAAAPGVAAATAAIPR
jgi:hypothetical protein